MMGEGDPTLSAGNTIGVESTRTPLILLSPNTQLPTPKPSSDESAKDASAAGTDSTSSLDPPARTITHRDAVESRESLVRDMPLPSIEDPPPCGQQSETTSTHHTTDERFEDLPQTKDINDFAASPQYAQIEKTFSASPTKVHSRAYSTAAAPQVTRNPTAAPTRTIFKVTQKPQNPRNIYYGVRKGHKPGIYYWYKGPDGSLQAYSGFSGALQQSFPIAKEVGELVKHLPTECSGQFCCKEQRKKEAEGSVRAPNRAERPAELAKNSSRSEAPTPKIKEGYSKCVNCGERSVRVAASICEACGSLAPDDTTVAIKQQNAVHDSIASREWSDTTDEAGPDIPAILHELVTKHGLCEEQAEVLRLVADGHNIFFTGAAGTGKSTTLRAIITYLKRLEKNVDVVAHTGIAALLLGGTTIHMYAGWTVNTGELGLKQLASNVGKKRVWKRLASTKVLIIDEISMLEQFTFARLDFIMRKARQDERPFGGVQLIVSGDFYQLPPVKPFKTCYHCGKDMTQPRAGDGRLLMDQYECRPCKTILHNHEKWAFCAEAWWRCGFKCVQLEQVHRQDARTDAVFLDFLNRHRKGGGMTEADEDLLIDHDCDVGEGAVKMYPFRRKVDDINDYELNRLPDDEKAYGCLDGSEWDQERHPDLADRFERVSEDDARSPFRAFVGGDRHRFEDRLKLKKNMPVLLLSNLAPGYGLVNGSRGTIVDFEPFTASNTSPRAYIDEHAEYRQNEVGEYMEKVANRVWPVVRFENGYVQTIYAHCEVTELGTDEPYSLMSRTQIPLMAGWAITVHKSQGMTLAQAIVDLDGAWESGHSYVATSRVKSLRGLKVYGLAKGKAIQADPAVQDFMEKTFGRKAKL